MSQTKYPKYITREVRKWLDNKAKVRGYGFINAYHCRQCQKALFTREIDMGVTPMMLKCLECGGTMYSAMYKVRQDEALATSEFYRPDDREFAKQSRAAQEHCRQGGLLLREIPA